MQFLDASLHNYADQLKLRNHSTEEISACQMKLSTEVSSLATANDQNLEELIASQRELEKTKGAKAELGRQLNAEQLKNKKLVEKYKDYDSNKTGLEAARVERNAVVAEAAEATELAKRSLEAGFEVCLQQLAVLHPCIDRQAFVMGAKIVDEALVYPKGWDPFKENEANEEEGAVPTNQVPSPTALEGEDIS